MPSHIVTILAYPNVCFFDIAGPSQVFSTTNQALGKDYYKVMLVGENAKPVVTDTGVSVLVDHGFDKIPEASDMIVPGGKGVDAALGNQKLLEYLKKALKNQRRKVSVCTGSLFLAEIGMLNGKQATCHWLRTDYAPDRYPQVNWDLEKIYTQDGDIYTSAGISTGVDLCLHLVEQDHGRQVALEVARRMVLFMQRSGSQNQYSYPLMMRSTNSTEISDLCATILDNPAKNWSIAEMTKVANMTERTLHRHFTKEFDESPSQFLERVRLDFAKSLFDAGEKSTKQVALRSGFGSEQTLRRAFVNRLHISPSEYRKRFGTAA